MPDIFETLNREWHHDEHAAAETIRRLMHPHHHGAPQPAAAAQPEHQPETPHNEHQEVTPMSSPLEVLDEIADHVKAAAARFETLDREALTKVAAIKATPEGAEAFELLSSLATATGGGPILSVVGGMLKSVAALAPQHQPAVPADPQPAMGPQVGGQA